MTTARSYHTRGISCMSGLKVENKTKNMKGVVAQWVYR